MAAAPIRLLLNEPGAGGAGQAMPDGWERIEEKGRIG